MENTQTFTDVPTLRRQAREHTGDGAVTAGYAADRRIVLQRLNEALATEIVCVLLRYRHLGACIRPATSIAFRSN